MHMVQIYNLVKDRVSAINILLPWQLIIGRVPAGPSCRKGHLGEGALFAGVQ